MQKIVSRGKDVQEAIKLGLQVMEVTKSEVDIEILQHEAKGFMGLRSKFAIVKLTKRNLAKSHVFQKNNESSDVLVEVKKMLDVAMKDDGINGHSTWDNKKKEANEFDDKNIIPQSKKSLAGKAWVENGQLFCQSSASHFPMVTVNDGITLYKNNELVTEKTTLISENHTYEIRVDSEIELVESKWEVSMDKHKLHVQVKVEPGYQIRRIASDIEPNHHIQLTSEKKKETMNSLTYNDLMRKLERLRVIHGFDQTGIIRAIETTEAGIFNIASGIKSTPGKDGWVEIVINMSQQEGPKVTENGNVDYREINVINSVEKGTVIAIVHPPIPGKIGYTVTNEPLPAKQTFPVVLKLGNGVMLLGDRVVATESGRPTFEQRGMLNRISIMTKLIHDGNVDIASGNIRFKGDVEITGEVEENMVVEAEGDITVNKTVYKARLTVLGSIITYGNVINSDITAGKNNLVIFELGQLLREIHAEMEKIEAIVKQLTLSPAFKSSDFSRGGLQPLIRILLEKKFKSFPAKLKKYIEIVNNNAEFLMDDEWSKVGISFTNIFLILRNEITTLENIIELSYQIQKLSELSDTPIEPNSYVTIPNALNSRFYCSGNVIILGQGSIHSKLHAGGSIKVNGVVRGGEVYGKLGVEINEAGSESGTATLISVPINQEIKINKVMEGTIIKLGSKKHTFVEKSYHVHARVTEEGRLLLN